MVDDAGSSPPLAMGGRMMLCALVAATLATAPEMGR
jgi:hypothetical protein